VPADESGKKAILELAGGDMRRVLNLLQTTHMAYPQVNEINVYLTAGAAMPVIIKQLLQSLLNDTFVVAYDTLQKTIADFGYALCDIITEISLLVANIELPNPVLSYIIDKLSTIEHRLSHGVSEKIQVGALVSSFVVARQMMVKK